MRQVAPLVVAILVAIGVALSPGFLPPQISRPSRSDALDIIEAVGDYELQSMAAEYQLDTEPLMPDAAKMEHIRIADATPCGEVTEPVRCHPIAFDRQSEIGPMLLASWQDAAKLLADRRRDARGRATGFEDGASSAAEHLWRLQIEASRWKGQRIPPSGLDEQSVRHRIKLLAVTRQHHVWTDLAPWLVGDVAFVEVGWNCGDMCGKGTGYALRKEDGKWRVVAVQDRWIV
jgi:hypothetical protein